MANQAIKLYKVSDTDKRVGINLPEGSNPSYSLYVSGSLRVTTVSRFDDKITIPLASSTYGEASSKARIQFVAPTTGTPFTPALMLPSKVGSWALATYPYNNENLYFVYNDGGGTANANSRRFYLYPGGVSGDTNVQILTAHDYPISTGNGGTGGTSANAGANNLLSGLPAWTAAATDDTYFIRQDTAGTNTFGRVKASTISSYVNGKLPVASQTQAGIVSTGFQHFGGTKGFNYIYTYGISGDGTAVRWSTDIQGHNSGGTLTNEIFYDAGTGTNVTTGVWKFRQYSPNSTASTTTTGKYEDYALPTVTTGRTNSPTYYILTTKGATMTAYFMLENGTQYPVLRFKPSVSTNNGDDYFGPASIFTTSGHASEVRANMMYFRVYSPTASSGKTTYEDNYEQFTLPAVNVGRTDNAGYSILTSKNTVTIAQGGTGATSAQNARTNLETKYWHAFEGLDSSNRLTSADQDPGNGKCIWFHATSSMTTHKPAGDGYILHFAWDNSSPAYATQLWLQNGGTGMQIRGRTSSAWGSWTNILTAGYMGWKKESMSFSNNSATTTATGVTITSVIQAIRTGDGSTGTFYAVGAASCSTNGTIRVNAANGSTLSGSVNIFLWWSKTATGG